MDKKKLLIIGGVLLVAGAGIYFWKKSKSSDVEESKETKEESKEKKDDAPKKVDSRILKIEETIERKPIKGTPLNLELEEKKPVVADKPKVKQLTAEELESKLQQSCGKKPLLKKNKKKYEQCRENTKAKLRGEGYISFSGEEEGVVPSSFYSSFDSHLDLDL